MSDAASPAPSAPRPPAPPPSGPAPARSGGGRRLALIVGAGAVVVIIVVGLWLAYRAPPDQIQGVMEAETLTIATKLPLSRVERLLVHEGEAVRAGQPLVVLSSPELDAKTEQAQGALSGAQAVQTKAEKGARVEDVASLRAVWQAAVAAADLAGKTYERTNNLYREGVVPAQRRDEALAARDASARNAEASRQQYEKAVRGATAEEKAVAAAQVQIAKAGVQEAASLRGETQLTAPRDGEIAKRMVNGGELAPLAFPIFTLVDLHEQWVTLNVREDQFHGLRMGQVLTGDVPALDRKGVRFKVDYISPQGDFATWRATRQSRGYDIRAFEVRARPVEPTAGLRPGMSVLFAWPQ